ncbi:hypothetical protein GCM10010466_28560 [Planomonospora alba]|uniref:Uncharacterized protein n=1 Tax=Planomonospora alba TaxID=161354 RepID=A0ABP6N4V7_9ACTN
MLSLAPVALVLAPVALVVVPPLADDMDPRRIVRFASRQRLVLTPSNAGRVLTYLRVTRRWRALGLTFGALAVLAFEPFITVSPFYPVLGWFAGAVVAEVRLARARPAGRADLGLRPAPRRSAWLWRASAVVAGALALAGAVRALSSGAAAAAVPASSAARAAAAAAVPVLLRGLRTRPLPAGPADEVAAEVAARSRSAQVLLAGGAVAALWCAVQAVLPPEPPRVLAPLIALVSWVVPLVALAVGTGSWAPAPRTGPERWWAAPVTAVATFAAAVALGTAFVVSAAVPPGKTAERTVRDEATTSSRPVAEASLPRCGTRQTVRGCAVWELIPVAGPGDWSHPLPLPQAAAFAGRYGALPRPAPFALSGDGFHAVYLDARTRRMVHHDLRTGARRDLTGPLADTDLPVPALSPDGRYAALAATGPGRGSVRLVDTGGGRSVEVPGLGRVLGVGPRGFAAVTVPDGEAGGKEAELAVVGLDGAVRSRVPYDPASVVRLFPDGRRLLVLTAGGEAVTVDSATGRTLRRVRLRIELDRYADAPEFLGWDDGGRALLRLDPDEPADGETHLVDPVTGKTAEAQDAGPAEEALASATGKVKP